MLAWGLLLFLLSGCGGPFAQTTFKPVSDFGRSIDNLYWTIFSLAVLVFLAVEGLLLFTVIRFRSRPNQPAPPRGHGGTLLEVAWTLAPVVILLFIAVPTMTTIFGVTGRESGPPGSLEVQVIGHQWWWEYRYPSLVW